MPPEQRVPGRQPPSGAPRPANSAAPNEKISRPADDSVAQLSPKAEPMYLRSSNEVGKSVEPVAIHTAALAEALDTCKSSLNGLLSKTHEIHEQSWRSVQSLFQDLHLRLCQECEAAIAGFEKEIRDRGGFETSNLLEIVDLEAKSRLAARVDESIEKIRETENRSQQERDEKVEAGRRSVNEIVESATQELQRQKITCLDDFSAEANSRLEDLKKAHIDDFVALSQKSAGSLSARFTESSEQTLQNFEVRLKQLSDDLTRQVEQRLSTLTEAAVARVASEARTVVTREASDYLIQTLRGRLDKVAVALKDINNA